MSKSPSASFIVIGLLRRDADVIHSGDDEAYATTLAEQAVREARVEEAFVLPVLAHFRASEINWANPDDNKAGPLSINSSTNPPLNPGSGEQEADPRNVPEASELVDPREARRNSMDAFGGESTRVVPAGITGSTSEAEHLANEAESPTSPNATVKEPGGQATVSTTKK